MKSQNLWDRAIEQFGEIPQIASITEELLELAILTNRKVKGTREVKREDVLDEVADVRLMLDQVCHIWGFLPAEVDAKVLEKMCKFSKFMQEKQKERTP